VDPTFDNLEGAKGENEREREKIKRATKPIDRIAVDVGLVF